VSILSAGLDWVAAHHTSPAIVTLSLGVQKGTWSTVLSNSVTALMKNYAVRGRTKTSMHLASSPAQGLPCEAL
jgi:hypothetical protein